MKRSWVIIVFAGVAAAWCGPLAAGSAADAAVAGAAGQVIAAGSWRNATEVPGLGALNAGGSAGVNSVSCASAGNCAAGGSYLNGSGLSQAFVVTETNGHWATAIKVPGSGLLNAGGSAGVNSVSCASAGNCAAGGSYLDGSGNFQAFVVTATNGRWGKAIEVRSSGVLNAGGNASVVSLSCASAGNCAAGGSYRGGSGRGQGFVVSEKNGRWGNAIKVPGLRTLNAGGKAFADSVSCRPAGNCAAAGSYRDGSGHRQAFVVRETNGRWGKAIEVPGTGPLNAGGNASVSSVSCASAGNCAAAGRYRDASRHRQAFVVSETNGRWGKAIEVPGSGLLNAGGNASVSSVSCASAGNCAAGGFYTHGSARVEAFLVIETKGRWRKAIEVPGSGALNAGGNASVSSVSCASAGNCAAGGFYEDVSSHLQAFVVSETNGHWATAIEVPGSGALNADGIASVNSVSCPSAGKCTAGGDYLDGSGNRQGFVVDQT